MNLLIILVITNFIRTFVVILVLWYGIKLFTKYVVPMMLHRTVKNMQSRMEEQYRDQQRGGRPEGEITVEQNSAQKPNKYKEGEYVDFEEVD
jgi:hypothetical protein